MVLKIMEYHFDHRQIQTLCNPFRQQTLGSREVYKLFENIKRKLTVGEGGLSRSRGSTER
jgi:hypothetical protein